MGLAFDGENIWASAGHTVYKIDHANGTVITSFNVPYSLTSNSSISGLTWFNNTLYCTYTAGFSSLILGIDVDNIICVDTLNSGECSSPTGLTYMNDSFWINDYVEIKVRKVNLEYGQWEGWFPHYNLCYKWVGLANDGEYMYCSDNFCNIYKYEIIDTITSINKNRNLSNTESNFNIYPNPTRGMVNIEFYLPVESKVTFGVYNMKGMLKVLIIKGKQYTKGKHTENWNAEGLVTGEYIIKLTMNKDVFNHKLIIKK